jgi:5'-nucleotidase
MMNTQRPQILLTNDDGIQSPGLWAAAEALSKLGFVTVAAPREQASGTGRSMPVTSDGKINATVLQIGRQEWTTYAVGGTPAQAVLHAIMEIMPQPPDLVVSGINYGENLGHSVTISGTVGAAMEGAACGIPSMAVSLQLRDENYLGYSREVDFSTAAHFTQFFADILLRQQMPEDVDILKIDIPNNATSQTPWRITRLAHHRYYAPEIKRSGSWEEPGGYIGGTLGAAREEVAPGTDVYVMAFEHLVAVTPMSMDMTARVDFSVLEAAFGAVPQTPDK